MDHHREYVTITQGMRGFFAVLIIDGEPWQTGIGSYRTAEEAIPEAMEWARDEAIPFVGADTSG